MAEHFAPVYHFRIILMKVHPSRFLAKVPRNLIMSKVQRKIIFYHSSHKLYFARVGSIVTRIYRLHSSHFRRQKRCSQPTQDIDQTFEQCWSTVYEARTTLYQYWVNASFGLGHDISDLTKKLKHHMSIPKYLKVGKKCN